MTLETPVPGLSFKLAEPLPCSQRHSTLTGTVNGAVGNISAFVSSSRRTDLRFDPQQMGAKINRIKTLLKQGISVRVWVIDADGFSRPVIQSNANNTLYVHEAAELDLS